MNLKKEKACHHNDRLTKKGEMLIDSAKILSQSNCPVKLITAQIQYCRLVEKMYRQNARVK